MRFSSIVTLAVAVLATDATAQRNRGYFGWRNRNGGGYRNNNGGSVIDAPCTDAAPEPTSYPVPSVVPEVPDYGEDEDTSSGDENVVEAPASGNTGGGSSSGNLESDQQAALDAHNAARSEVGTSPLAWDDALAAAAQEWADHLTSVGSLTHSSGTGHGENLYMQSGSGRATGPFTSASDMWIAEKSDYSGQPVGSGNFGAYGHYTQAVWKSTTKVGMASATDSSGRTYVVARYSPPGNFIGQTPY